MAFLVKVPWAIVSVSSQLFQGKPNGFKQLFDILIYNRMDTLRKKTQSFVDYVLNYRVSQKVSTFGELWNKKYVADIQN